MKKAQFLGWFKKAYPDIRCTKSTAFDNVYVINGRKVSYVSIKEDTQNVLFYGDSAVTPCELDEDIVMKCRDLYGEPRVIFQYSTTKVKLTQDKIKDDLVVDEDRVKTSKSEEKQPKEKESIDDYNKESILSIMKEKFGDKLKTVSKYSKTETYVDEISGPILGDQGLSPNNKMRYKFILYSDKTEIKQILENFFNLFN